MLHKGVIVHFSHETRHSLLYQKLLRPFWYEVVYVVILHYISRKKKEINIREVTDSYFLAASMMLFLKKSLQHTSCALLCV